MCLSELNSNAILLKKPPKDMNNGKRQQCAVMPLTLHWFSFCSAGKYLLFLLTDV